MSNLWWEKGIPLPSLSRDRIRRRTLGKSRTAHPRTEGERNMVNETRRRWLSDYQRELSSGKWGRVLSIWFDEPLDGDIPWEPCAIVQQNIGGKTVYIVVVEDFMADPRCLKEDSRYDRPEPAYCRVASLRPWNLGTTWGYQPSNEEWNRWFKEYPRY